MVRTLYNNYTHLKKFEEGIKKYIKKGKTGSYKVGGMKGEIEYWPANIYEADRNPGEKGLQYHVPGAFYDRGIKSEMFARYMTFTSWSYKREGNRWKRDSFEPVPKLVIENELPNWQTPVIPSTGTVNQDDLVKMADFLVDGNQKTLFQKKANLIHPILTYHNYMNEADWVARVDEFSSRDAELLHAGKKQIFNLTAREFVNLREGIILLVRKDKITYH